MGCLSAWSGLGFGIGLFLAVAPGRPWWQRLAGLALVWTFFFFIGYFWVVGAVAQSTQFAEAGSTQRIDDITVAAVRFFSQAALYGEGLAVLVAGALGLFFRARGGIRSALPGLALLFALAPGLPLMAALAGILAYSQYLTGSPAFAGAATELLGWLALSALSVTAGFVLSRLTAHHRP